MSVLRSGFWSSRVFQLQLLGVSRVALGYCCGLDKYEDGCE